MSEYFECKTINIGMKIWSFAICTSDVNPDVCKNVVGEEHSFLPGASACLASVGIN